MHYWDTSALLKLYVTESDSAEFRAHAHSTGPLLTSDLSRWELYVAFQRKEAAGDLSTATGEVFYIQFETDIAEGRVRVLALETKMNSRFQSLVRRLHRSQPPIWSRTLDALHLSVALMGQAEEFVTADRRQAQAAIALGLTVFPRT